MPAPIVENAVFLPLDGFSSLVEDQVTIGVWVHLWVFNSVPLVYLSVTIPVPCSFDHNCSVGFSQFLIGSISIGAKNEKMREKNPLNLAECKCVERTMNRLLYREDFCDKCME